MTNYLLYLKFKGKKITDYELRYKIAHNLCERVRSLNELNLPTSITLFDLNNGDDATVYSFSSNHDYGECSKRIKTGVDNFKSIDPSDLEFLLIDLDKSIKELKEKIMSKLS